MLPRRFFNFVFNLILDILFPWQCFNCKKETKNLYPLCPQCQKTINLIEEFICPSCGKRMIFGSKSHSFCKRKTKISALGVLSSYNDPIIKQAVHLLKYEGVISFNQFFSNLTVEFLKNSNFFSCLLEEKPIIISVPLHQKKKKQRGFNQSELLASKIADYFTLERRDEVILRAMDNQPQFKIKDPVLRKENVKGIFKVASKEILKNKTIILIDDVYTSGATMEEAAKTLKENGAKKIVGFVLAKG